MKRGPLIVLVFILVVAAVIGASQFLRAQPPLEITLAASPLAQAWLMDAVSAFNASEPMVNSTRRVHVTLSPMDDLAVWSDSGQNAWRDNHPTAWIPASSASLAYASRFAFEVVQPSTAQTVLAWGGFSDRVSALTGGSHPLDWDDVSRAAEAGRWGNIDGAQSSWGNVNLAFSRPDGSMGGLAGLLSGAGAFNKGTSLGGGVVVGEAYKTWMRPILDSVPNANMLGASVAKTLATTGTSVGDIALLPESEWLNNLTGKLTASSDPIQLSYPTYQFIFDFPLVRWQGLSADEDAAVGALGKWLLAQHPENYGLRPASGTAPQSAALFANAESYGAQLAPDMSQTVQAPPRTDTQRLLQWAGS